MVIHAALTSTHAEIISPTAASSHRPESNANYRSHIASSAHAAASTASIAPSSEVPWVPAGPTVGRRGHDSQSTANQPPQRQMSSSKFQALQRLRQGQEQRNVIRN